MFSIVYLTGSGSNISGGSSALYPNGIEIGCVFDAILYFL